MTDQPALPEPDASLSDDERQIDLLPDPLAPTDSGFDGEDYTQPLLDDDDDDDVVGELDDAAAGGPDA